MSAIPSAPCETFPALTAHDSIAAHAFVRRIPGVDLPSDKAEALARLAPFHQEAVTALGFPLDRFFTAGQVHGNGLAVITGESPRHTPEVDGLLTSVPGLLLGIHVADCGPVYLLDPIRRAVALLHSGKKGTELDITGKAAAKMQEVFGSRPEDLVLQLGPCIRVPQYDVDFAAAILAGARRAGITRIHDCGTCTAQHPGIYYSYRREQGKTGRLLALLGLRPAAPEAP